MSDKFLKFVHLLVILHISLFAAASSYELEDRLNAIEKQGREQALLVHQQGQEIIRLNAELRTNKDLIQRYKQEMDHQSKTIQQHERRLTEQTYDHTKYAIEMDTKLTLYKTQLTIQEERLEVLELALPVNEPTKENEMMQTEETDLRYGGVIAEADEKMIVKPKERHGISDLSGKVKAEVKGEANGTHNQAILQAGKDLDQEETIGDPTNKHKRLAIGNIESPIAFHATTDKGEVTHVGIRQNIVLDVVLLNLGNGYHNQHGVFITPVAGVYSFSASILSSYNAAHPEVQVNLMKNGQPLGKVYAHGDNGRHDQGAITAVTQLGQGDEVWLEELNIVDASYFGARFTAFSGFLIYQN